MKQYSNRSLLFKGIKVVCGEAPSVQQKRKWETRISLPKVKEKEFVNRRCRFEMKSKQCSRERKQCSNFPLPLLRLSNGVILIHSTSSYW